ncbi:MAG: MATE family efflux transporter [Oscillospiraceae bacterium]|nr:MATE family efflux transporter [Oscillospiraceae bacterium]
MTAGSPLKLIILFALPLLAGNILQQTYSITDAVIVGSFAENSDDIIAAIGVSMPIMFLMMALFFGIGQGASIIISQFYGAGDKEGIKRAVDTIYLFLVVVSVPLTVTGLIICRPLLELINTEGEILENAVVYLSIMFAGILMSFGFNLNNGILNGLGNSKISLLFLGIATMTNIVLDLVFLIVLEWGVAGVAFATITAQSTAFVFGIIHINRKDYGFKISFNIKKLTPDLKLLKNVARIGLPGGIQNMLFSLGFMFLFNLVNTINSDNPGFTAGFTMAQKIDAFAFLPIMTFAAAITTFVGQNVGAGDLERVKKGVRTTCLLGIISSLIVCAAVLPLSEHILKILTKTPEVIEYGQAYLFRMMPFISILAVNFIISNSLRGAGQAMIPLLGSLLGLWLARIPAAYFLAWLMPETPENIYFSFVIGWCIGIIPVAGYYLSGKWKEKADRFVKKE